MKLSPPRVAVQSGSVALGLAEVGSDHGRGDGEIVVVQRDPGDKAVPYLLREAVEDME
jgi:hypothetical protein